MVVTAKTDESMLSLRTKRSVHTQVVRGQPMKVCTRYQGMHIIYTQPTRDNVSSHVSSKCNNQ